MTDIFTSITTAIGLTKQLVDLADATKNAQAKLVIADLQIQLAQLKVQLAELIDENRELKSALSQKTEEKPKLKIEGDLYYTEDGDGPFCTSCFETKVKLVRVTPMASAFHTIAKFRCNICHGHFHGSKSKENPHNKRFKRTRTSGGFSVCKAFPVFIRLSFIAPLVRPA